MCQGAKSCGHAAYNKHTFYGSFFVNLFFIIGLNISFPFFCKLHFLRFLKFLKSLHIENYQKGERKVNFL